MVMLYILYFILFINFILQRTVSLKAHEDNNKNKNVKKTSKSNPKKISSRAMNSTGDVDIFNRSIKCNIIYKEYLRDGDTSSFNDVVISEPYVKQHNANKAGKHWTRAKTLKNQIAQRC